MMAARWRFFTFNKQIENPKMVVTCLRCFAELVIEGVEAEM